MAASSLLLLAFEGREIPAINDELEILLLLVLLQATAASSLEDDDIVGCVCELRHYSKRIERDFCRIKI